MMCVMLLLLLTPSFTPGLVHSSSVLPVPQAVSVRRDLGSQALVVSWLSDASQFDIEIYRPELMELALNSVSVAADPVTRSREWAWHSPVPLECTSHSVRIRARELDAVSQWSPLQTIPGMDVPDRRQGQMYPQDRVLEVGGNVTLCCIVPEGVAFSSMRYRNHSLASSMLSRRSFVSTLPDLQPSISSGTNVVCCSETSIITGTVLFIGYPPADEGLLCETRDLQTAECRWRKGRDTNFWKRSILTRYTLNNRPCVDVSRDRKQCRYDRWENNWTLLAENPLGSVRLNDSAHIAHRVRLLAPVNVSSAAEAWRATVGWSWTVKAYKDLELVCMVELNSGGRSDTRNFTGVGLSSMLLERLKPDVEYTFSIRCASLQHFWRWGDWSAPYSLHTLMDLTVEWFLSGPEAPDVWVWRTSKNTGQVFWKPLSAGDSHGALTGYEVYQRDGDGERWTIISLTPSSSPISLSNTSDDTVIATAARNPAGVSQRSTIIVPQFLSDPEVSVSELVGSREGLVLSWNGGHNASQGYVVEWVPTCCSGLCSVQWQKVSSSNTSTVIQSGSLEAGVQYTVSVFVLLPEATVLLQRHHAYGEQLVPSQPVGALSARQSGSDVVLSWTPVSSCDQRGFVRGYTVYLADASNLSLIANLTDPAVTLYTMKNLPLGSYKFSVRSYTSAGESSGSPVSIKTESDADMMVLEILVALGVMSLCLIFISIFCYKKREWVKKAFYPEIPGPKLTGDWSAPPAPLDVKPPPHSLVHIVESPDKEGLMLVPEEQEEPAQHHHDDEENVEMDTDSDEPTLLRYYNQLVSDGSGFSGSSEDSAQTQVTYTGIQSPGYRPQVQPGVRFGLEQEEEAQEEEQENPGAGYKPQCSWRPHSPENDNLSGSLGSPTSVTSSQFLIPEPPEDPPEPRGTWLHHLFYRSSN
ncbi:LIF receptor subunit alpha a isoform X2 [Trichomycterus rosablanca]|uniref:LIF receptor subunit alpha a isoform X2 n=1 Tax=Trichomycterus rosablanca TaxID=2290929 RepID=UPI002F34F16A